MKKDQRLNTNAATIKDVAKLANVSKSTVSRFTNNQGSVSMEAEIRIKEAIETLKYRPNSVARALKAKSTKSLGLIIPSIENPVFPPMVKVIEDTARKYGFSTILCNSEGDIELEVKYLELLIEKQIDGIIFNAIGKYDERFQLVKESNTPIIILGKKLEHFQTTNVTTNNYFGAYMAVEHIIKTGMRDIVFLSGSNESSSAIDDRFEGYKAALKANSIKYNEELVVKHDRTFDGGISAINELISRKLKFDSIFASNDLMAIGAMERLSEHNYNIPQDVSIIGYDDILSSRIIKPRLSTVANPVSILGVEAVKTILRMIYTKKDKYEEFIFEPKLVIRETTKAII